MKRTGPAPHKNKGAAGAGVSGLPRPRHFLVHNEINDPAP